MNKFKMLVVVGVAMLPLSMTAHAADIAPDVPSEVETSQMGLYLRGDVGGSFLKWSGGSDDESFVAGGGIGYQYNEMFRTDLTVDFTGDYKIAPGAEISTTTILGNAYLDFANDTMFTPYIGAGVGYGWVNGKGTSDKDGLALGAAAGVSLDLTSNLAIDVGYRFRDIMVSGSDTMEHQATVGMRFKF